MITTLNRVRFNQAMFGGMPAAPDPTQGPSGMRLLFGPDATGEIQVTDADTGAILTFEASQVVPDDVTGKAWLWLGTTKFGQLNTVAGISSTPTPTPAPTPAPATPAS